MSYAAGEGSQSRIHFRETARKVPTFLRVETPRSECPTMSVPVRCTGCGFAFKVADQYAGRKGKCPNCAHSLGLKGRAAGGRGIAGSPSGPARQGAIGAFQRLASPALYRRAVVLAPFTGDRGGGRAGGDRYSRLADGRQRAERPTSTQLKTGLANATAAPLGAAPRVAATRAVRSPARWPLPRLGRPSTSTRRPKNGSPTCSTRPPTLSGSQPKRTIT